VNIGGTGALTNTQRILTATTALGDVYAIKEALGNTRFMASAVWAFNSIVGDTVFRFVASGSITEPQIMPAGRCSESRSASGARWRLRPLRHSRVDLREGAAPTAQVAGGRRYDDSNHLVGSQPR
jgi:hypothetical protein